MALAGPEALGPLRPAVARVDLDRLAGNYRALAAFAGRPLIPVVKADAYGHGAAAVALRLEGLGAPMLAVAYAEEGAALRAAGVRLPILVMAGFGPGQASALAENGLVPVVSSPETLELAVAEARRAGSRGLEAHLKLDTGMSRLGFAAAEAVPAAERLAAGGVRLTGLMTQLSAADEDEALSRRQLDAFDATLDALGRRGLRPEHVHVANSAGLVHLRSSHTLARPGLILYGVKPRPLAPPVEVLPVMSVRARIGLLREIEPGTAVSYGGRFRAARASRIAVLPLGYADGVPRTQAMSERGWWSIAGRRAPVAGAVCMDLTMADVTDVPEAEVGTQAVLFGDEPSAWDVAAWAGTTAWQVLTSVGPRVPRVYVEGGRVVAVDSRYA